MPVADANGLDQPTHLKVHVLHVLAKKIQEVCVVDFKCQLAHSLGRRLAIYIPETRRV